MVGKDTTDYWPKTHWFVLGATLAAFMLTTSPLLDAATRHDLNVFSFAFTKLYIQILTISAVPVIAITSFRGGMEIVRHIDLVPRLLLFFVVSGVLASAIAIGTFLLLQPGLVDGVPILGAYSVPDPNSSVLIPLGALGDLTIRIQKLNASMMIHGFDLLSISIGSNEITALLSLGLASGIGIALLRLRNVDRVETFTKRAQAVAIHIPRPILLLTPVVAFSAVLQCRSSDMSSLVWEVLLKFMLAVLVALFLHSALTMSILLVLARKSHPISHAEAMAPALVRGFVTANSTVTLPLTLECAGKRAGIDSVASNFTLPIGTNLIRNGSLIYQVISVLFIMQGSAVPLHDPINLLKAGAFGVVYSALIPSMPSGSLNSIREFLEGGTCFGIAGLTGSHLGIGPILIVDRVLDMFRTAVNVHVNSVGAAFVQGRHHPPRCGQDPGDAGSAVASKPEPVPAATKDKL